MLSLKQFEEFAKKTPAEVNRPKPYLQDHLLRFYETYREASARLSFGARLLSVGAGRAYVECALAKHHNIRVTVFDFPEAVQRNADQYKAFNFESISGNFLETSAKAVRANPFDGLLFCEIVEHIPMPPAQQFRKLAEFLHPGGFLLTTTPNIASAKKIARLMRGKNIIAPAERLFSPVAAENEEVHRREYTLAEMTAALKSAGLTPEVAKFIDQNKAFGSFASMSHAAATRLATRFKPMLLTVGRRS